MWHLLNDSTVKVCSEYEVLTDAREGNSCAFMLQYVREDSSLTGLTSSTSNGAHAGVSPSPHERQSDRRSICDEDDRDLPILAQACGELEDFCSCCGERLEAGSVKVGSGAALWVHVQCWNANHSTIISLFEQNMGTSAQLCALAQIAARVFQGWHDLDCMKRMALTSKMFYTHAAHAVTARDIPGLVS